MIELLRNCWFAWKTSKWMPEPFDWHGYLLDVALYGECHLKSEITKDGSLKLHRVDIYK
jgi:hypothetical protein